MLGLRDDVYRDAACAQHVGQPSLVEEQSLDGKVGLGAARFREQRHDSLRPAPSISRGDMHDSHGDDPLTPERRVPPPTVPTSGSDHAAQLKPWTRLARKIREVGVRYTLALGMRVVIPAAVFRFARIAILQILPQDVSGPVVVDERIRWATPHDSARLEAFGHTPDVLQRRFTAGARVCTLAERGRLLAYVWFHAPDHDEEDLGVRFSLAPGEIRLFDAMVRADQRGRGLYPRLLEAATRDLAREGVHRTLIAIENANRNSLRAHQAAGAKGIAMVCGLRILGFTFVRHGHSFRAAWTGTTGYVRLLTSSIA